MLCQQDGFIDAVMSLIRAGGAGSVWSHDCLQRIALHEECKEQLLMHSGLIDLLVATLQKKRDAFMRVLVCHTIKSISSTEKAKGALLEQAGLLNVLVETMKRGRTVKRADKEDHCQLRLHACETISNIASSPACARRVFESEGLISALKSVTTNDERKLQAASKQLLDKISSFVGAAPPPRAPPSRAPPAPPAPPALPALLSTVGPETLRGENVALRRENSDLRRENSELRERMASVEMVIGGGVCPVVDLTNSDDGTNVAPPPAKLSALSLVAEKREEGGRVLKKDLETEVAKDELSENNKMTEIDALKARIRELEGAN